LHLIVFDNFFVIELRNFLDDHVSQIDGVRFNKFHDDVQIMFSILGCYVIVLNLEFNNIKQNFNSSLISGVLHENSVSNGFNHKLKSFFDMSFTGE